LVPCNLVTTLATQERAARSGGGDLGVQDANRITLQGPRSLTLDRDDPLRSSIHGAQPVRELSGPRAKQIPDPVGPAVDRAEREGDDGAREVQQSAVDRSEEHTSELQSRGHLVCRLLLE